MDHGLPLLRVEAIEQGVVNRDLGRHAPRLRLSTDKRRLDAWNPTPKNRQSTPNPWNHEPTHQPPPSETPFPPAAWNPAPNPWRRIQQPGMSAVNRWLSSKNDPKGRRCSPTTR